MAGKALKDMTDEELNQISLSFTPGERLPPSAPAPEPTATDTPPSTGAAPAVAAPAPVEKEEYTPPVNNRDPELDKLPDIFDMPEMSMVQHPSMDTARAQLGTLTTGADETKKVIQGFFPDVKIETGGPTGEYMIATSKLDGKKYRWRPGADTSDFTRAAKWMGLMAAGGVAGKAVGAVIPRLALATGSPAAVNTVATAGRAIAALPSATTVPGAMLAGVGGATLEEINQGANRGSFDGGAIPVAGLSAGAMSLAGKALNTAQHFVRGTVPLADRVAAVRGMPLAEALAAIQKDPELRAAFGPGGLGGNVQGAPAAAAPDAAFAQAARAPIGNGVAGQPVHDLAAQYAQKPNVVQAANDLGVLDNLTPALTADVSKNPGVLKLDQAMRSSAASMAGVAQREGLADAGQTILDGLKTAGADFDLSRVNKTARGVIESVWKELQQTKEDLYEHMMAPRTPIQKDVLDEAVKQIGSLSGRADEMKGIAGVLAKLRDRVEDRVGKNGQPLKPKITPPDFGLIDDEAKKWGAQTVGMDSWDSPQKGMARKVYSILDGVREKTAEFQGVGDQLRKAKDATIAAKTFEDDITEMLKRQLQDGVIEGDISRTLEQGFRGAAKGQTDKLLGTLRAMRGIPADKREEIVLSVLSSAMVGKNGGIDLTKAESILGPLINQTETKKALTWALGKDVRDKLTAIRRLGRNVSEVVGLQTGNNYNASAGIRAVEAADTLTNKLLARASGQLPRLGAGIGGTVGGIAGGLMGGAGIGMAGAGVGTAGGAVSGGLLQWAFQKSLTPMQRAVDDLLVSPELTTMIRGAAGQVAVTPQLIKGLLAKPVVRRFLGATRTPKDQWLSTMEGLLRTTENRVAHRGAPSEPAPGEEK